MAKFMSAELIRDALEADDTTDPIPCDDCPDTVDALQWAEAVELGNALMADSVDYRLPSRPTRNHRNDWRRRVSERR